MDKTLIIAILGPILLTFGGIITWLLKSKREDVLLSEERTREFKIKTYEALLEPFVTVFTFTLKDYQKQKGINKLLTLEYRKAAFNLMTFGSDEVVQSYNKIMQTFYNLDANELGDQEYAEIMLAVFSEFLLNIRKDLYTRKTNLKRSELVEFMLNDIETYRDNIDKMIIKNKTFANRG